MDVKDLRTETALSERNNDGSKYSQGGAALPCNRNKSYQDIGSNPLAKTESPPVRPCAVIGPDRVVPPPNLSDPFLKKGSVEPWPGPDNVYRRPPDYPLKAFSSQNPSRNISPRQTFQENMQRIMVPPTYNAIRHGDDRNGNSIHDRNVVMSKNAKPNLAPEAKYCDVPYAINPLTNEAKTIKDAEMYVPSVNSPLARNAPPGWPPGSVSMQAPRTFGAHELYRYSQYPNCAGPRPTVIPISRSHRAIQDDTGFVYPDPYYSQDPNIRYKPYPPVKERYSQPRYDYLGSHPGSFHPPPIQTHKYDLPKSGQTHPYPVYPHLKYLDGRIPDHTLESYQRQASQHQAHFNIQYRNQVIHPAYASVPGNIPQNKLHPYPPDSLVKPMPPNKAFEHSNKIYIDYENARAKAYPMTENCFVNEMARFHQTKNQLVMPNYPSVGGMHSTPTPQYYRKENSQMKPCEYMGHLRNLDSSISYNALTRLPPQFSPNTLAISPTDSSTSNDTAHTQGTIQEDCGYVSQSSTASMRSIDSSMYRLPNDYKRFDYRYSPTVGSSPMLSKFDLNSNNSIPKDNKQKQIDVRQFLEMWNESEEDNSENNHSKVIVQTGTNENNNQKLHTNGQDQLYVLGLVNVPNEELSKYEHVQKISKLPENIKGYNSLELLNQFEEAIESSKTNIYKPKTKDIQLPAKEIATPKQLVEVLRPVSPLDVEAKISQSVIHKEVGCNFEIRPCSPKMLNVEIAAPVQNVLDERVIEKIKNPLTQVSKSPTPMKTEESSNCTNHKRQDNAFSINNSPSCKMVSSPFITSNIDSVKTNYSLQDLEINSGVCLASLPRLDNEIELNFPEVNQQFINANKKDINSAPDASSLNKINNEGNLSENILGKSDTDSFDNIHGINDSEKSFTKLSQYRKIKPSPNHQTEINEPTKILRTDSVIIKNPENVKNMEDKLLESNVNTAINLTSQSPFNYDTHSDLSTNLYDKKDTDIALDFSLNKSGDDLSINKNQNNKSMKIVEDKFPKLPYETIEICENDVTQTNEACNYNTSKSIANFEDSDGIHTVSNEILCENREDKKLDSEINIEMTPSSVEENVTISTILASTSGEMLLENAPPVKEHIHNENEIMNKKDEVLAESVNIYENSEHILKEQSCNNEDIKPEEETSTSIESVCNINTNTDIKTEKILSPALNMQEDEDIFSCDKSNITYSPSQVQNRELTISHNINILENDEISASLEKIFQEDTEEIVMFDKSKDDFDTSLPLFTKPRCSYKSKELYSPFIQKLLIHNEGFCSLVQNETILDESTNSLIKYDTHKQGVTDSPQTVIKEEVVKLDIMELDDKIYATNDPEVMAEDIIEKPCEETISTVQCVDIKTNHVDQDTGVETFEDINISSPITNDVSAVNFDEVSTKSMFEKSETGSDEFEKLNLIAESDDIITEMDILHKRTAPSKDVIKIEMESVVDVEMHKSSINCNETNTSNDSENLLDVTNELNSADCANILDANRSGDGIDDRESQDVVNCNLNKDIARSSDETIVQTALACPDTSSSEEAVKEYQEENYLDQKKIESNIEIPDKTHCPHNADDNKTEETQDDSISDETFDTSKDDVVEKPEILDTKNTISELDKIFEEDSVIPHIDNSEHNSNVINNSDDQKVENYKINDKKELLNDMEYVEEDISFNNTVTEDSVVHENSTLANVDDCISKAYNEDKKESSDNVSLANNTLSDTNNDSLLVDGDPVIPLECGEGSENSDCANENAKVKLVDTIPDTEESITIRNEDVTRHRRSLKRSYSDSALNNYGRSNDKNDLDKTQFIWPSKRQKVYEIDNTEHTVIAEDLCSILQSTRRNSVSSFCNEENVSICILIENNCIIGEENEEEKICFAEIPEECVDEININEVNNVAEEDVLYSEENELDYSEDVVLDYDNEKSIQESWIDDVACVETVVSDDIAENVVISDYDSPKVIEESVYTEDDIFNSSTCNNAEEESVVDINEGVTDNYTESINKYIDNVEEEDDQPVSPISPESIQIYRTSHIDVNQMISNREFEKCGLYGDEYLEKILGSNSPASNYIASVYSPSDSKIPEDKENMFMPNILLEHEESLLDHAMEGDNIEKEMNDKIFNESNDIIDDTNTLSNVVNDHSCESSVDNVFNFKQIDEDVAYTSSSSPEVSSTTSEEKGSSILLKITNFNGSRISQINEINHNRPRCKFTEEKKYAHSHSGHPNKPLRTKAAQKYIPPIKETIGDLKVKLSLPQQRLVKLKQLKLSRNEPKGKSNSSSVKPMLPKKTKPNFEEVLKSIDAVQIKMHKEKSKKTKHVIPKVFIKKNENGSHYTSSTNKDTFNPDLTGRKWQPWVFLEKNHFIDKMAIRHKSKAIFSHRKNTYVLVEKFKKYKSVNSAKFVISQPKASDASKGQLKYTIRLKHAY